MKSKPMFTSRIAAILSTCLMVVTASAQPAAPFDGFNVDEHAQPLPPPARASLMTQLRIVEASGVPPEVLAFFKGVPIVVDPAQTRQPGEYANRDGRKAVFIQDRPMGPKRPIVLHELLHAYHATILRTEGPAIAEAYRQAIESNAYPEDFRSAHFLKNDHEYFAVIGSIYLFGPIQQPPFDCAITREKAPRILDILERQFGRHACG